MLLLDSKFGESFLNSRGLAISSSRNEGGGVWDLENDILIVRCPRLICSDLARGLLAEKCTDCALPATAKFKLLGCLTSASGMLASFRFTMIVNYSSRGFFATTT
jgi:hypothetical protein